MLKTGAEYLESIRDGRKVYIGSEVVTDVTTHPAFRNAAQSFARLYDRKRDVDNLAVCWSRCNTALLFCFSSPASPTWAPTPLQLKRNAITRRAVISRSPCDWSGNEQINSAICQS